MEIGASTRNQESHPEQRGAGEGGGAGRGAGRGWLAGGGRGEGRVQGGRVVQVGTFVDQVSGAGVGTAALSGSQPGAGRLMVQGCGDLVSVSVQDAQSVGADPVFGL